MTYLCLDLGTKHTGVAISYEGKLASPLLTISCEPNELIARLTSLFARTQPDLIIIGEPAAGPVKTLASEIYLHFSGNYHLVLHSEDLSSEDATRLMIYSPKEQKKPLIHERTAALILQDYLDTRL